MRVPLTMLHPALGPGWWTFQVRDGTDDETVIEEMMVLDVYGLRGLDTSGWPAGEADDGEKIPGATVVDLGAHIGVFTATALMMGAARVIAVEPDPENFDLLRQNTARLSDSVELWHAGIGAASGETIVAGAGAQAMTGADSLAGEPVEQVTLAHLLGPHGRIALLKVDVEGAEYDALLATPSSVLAKVDRIVMEWHGPEECPWLDRPRIGELVEHLLVTHSPSVFGKPGRGGYLFAHANDR